MVRLPPATDLIDLVLVRRQPGGGAAGAGSVLVLVPSTGWAERLSARLVRRGYPVAGFVGGGARGVARRSSGAAPPRGLRRRVSLRPSSSTRTMMPIARRARPRTARSTSWSSAPVGTGCRASLASPIPPVAMAALRGSANLLAGDGARSGRVGPSSSGWTGAAPTPAPACSQRSSSGWPVPCSTTRRPGPADRSCASTTARAAHGSSPAGTVASWPAATRCGAAAQHPRGEEVLRCPRCGESRPVVCASLRPAAHEDVARRCEPAARGAVRVARDRGGRGGRRRRVRWRRRCQTHRSSWGPRRSCTGCAAPRVSPSSTSICTCSRRGCRPPRRPSRCSCGPGAWSGGVAGRPWARVQAQTRVPDHAVLQAAALGEPAPVLDEEVAIRRASGAPTLRRAGAGDRRTLAAAFVDALAREPEVVDRGGVRVRTRRGPLPCCARPRTPRCATSSNRAARPAGRGLRVEVDPVTV